MKKEITIEVQKCDFCGKDDYNHKKDITTCWMCGKDFCGSCGSEYSGEEGSIPICDECYETIYDKAEKAGYLENDKNHTNEYAEKIRKLKEDAAEDEDND